MLALVTAIAFCAACRSAQDGSWPHLVLEESSSVTLPTEYNLRGATLADYRDFLYWGETSITRVSAGTGNTRTICGGRLTKPCGVAFVGASGGIEVVDGATGAVYRSGAQGTCELLYTIDEPDSIVSAVRLDTGWVIASADSADGTKIAEYSPFGQRAWVASGALQGTHGLGVHLTASPAGVLVSSTQWPFRWLSVEANGETRLASSPLSFHSDRGLPDDSTRWAGWVALPVLRLDRGYLQTLADLASDTRRLVLYDDQGRVQSVRDVNVPFGIIGSFREKQVLIGLRRTDRLELVVYRWRWENADVREDVRRL